MSEVTQTRAGLRNGSVLAEVKRVLREHFDILPEELDEGEADDGIVIGPWVFLLGTQAGTVDVWYSECGRPPVGFGEHGCMEGLIEEFISRR